MPSSRNASRDGEIDESHGVTQSRVGPNIESCSSRRTPLGKQTASSICKVPLSPGDTGLNKSELALGGVRSVLGGPGDGFLHENPLLGTKEGR